MRPFPLYRQLDQMDCGPTCLQMITQFHGRYFSLQYIRNKCFITREGVSLLGISDAAEALGLRTIGAKVTLNKLTEEATLPLIVHWYQNHFIVIYKIKKGRFYAADPAIGYISYSKEEFMKGWLSSKEKEGEQGIILLLEPTQSFYENKSEDKISDFKSVTYLFGYLRNQYKLLAQLILGLLTGSLIQLVLPFLTQSIVDVGINTQNVKFIELVLLGQIMLFVGRTAVDFLRKWILLYLSTRINISLISDFLLKLFKLPMSFFEGKMLGDILRRIDDHARIERFLSSSSLNILFSFFNLLIFGIVLLIYSIPIFFVFFGFSSVYVVYVLLFMKKRAEFDYKRFQVLADNQSNLIQSVQGMAEIKMNNSETNKRWEWERIQAKLFHLSVSATRLQQFQDVGSIFINEAKNVLITVMAAIAVIDGNMTLGMMLAVQYIIGQLNVPINDFVLFTRDWQDARLSLERVSEVHSHENEEATGDHVKQNEIPRDKTITLTDLVFGYDGPHSPAVLDGINLVIPHGKVTAIVGASGSGKTTLMKLLVKFYSPQSGSIKINDIDINQISSNAWRKQCGTVLQDGFIFADTIANNIAMAGDQVDKNRLLHSVEVASIKEFIESLPLRYNTKVGMNGNGLSQGQKQRILIARAVYKNPDVIFFDEATSSLDANNERKIMENLDLFLKDKTVIVIAHRLSTVKKADQIVVLEKGKIAEIGTHAELSLLKGRYFELVRNQLELGE